MDQFRFAGREALHGQDSPTQPTTQDKTTTNGCKTNITTGTAKQTKPRCLIHIVQEPKVPRPAGLAELEDKPMRHLVV
ncbi:hypothetical protein BRADI_1g22995v3 [Brachypodium distachyon]|uniref:Uncharacterized protein n=1 Tax=Brachypodium distachyon TaxID=15368 RepID=A0A2K2DKP8_BRADI|nr:hypothetical protein BRADI_1g22995v3 [Brachypodium distachyon]